MKFHLSYTLKDEEKFSGFHGHDFETREAAERFKTDNADSIYWSQITEKDAASRHPKVVISETPPGEEWDRLEGSLQTYFETGMECLGLVFYKDGFEGPPNPDFNPDLPEEGRNFRNYSSHEALEFLDSGMILEIDGVRYAMYKDRDFAAADGYRLGFYPRGFSRKELLELFSPENKRAVLYKTKEKKK